MRSISLTLAALALGATLAFATPQVRVESFDGLTRLVLSGDYARSRYTVFRALKAAGDYVPITQVDVLCLGVCVAEDPAARPGETYWYRFDFLDAGGARVSLGPYAVTIPATLARTVGVRILPNPVRGAAEIEIHLAGRYDAEPARAEVRVLDLQGRLVREVSTIPLPRGISRLRWDGLDGTGRPAVAGAYFVTVRSPLGDARTRLVRVR
jgi:hypothetical protein